MTTVKVGPFDFKVVEIERSEDWGFYDPVKMEIAVQSDCHKHVKAETLVHEILHAIWDVYSVKKGDGEERIITAMAMGVSACIRDNPDFWRAILGDLT
jgi:hypothetical protein